MTIRTDKLKDSGVNSKFKLRLRQKMNIIGQRAASYREQSIEKVWAECKEGILSTTVTVSGVRHNKGQRKRTRCWNE